MTTVVPAMDAPTVDGSIVVGNALTCSASFHSMCDLYSITSFENVYFKSSNTAEATERFVDQKVKEKWIKI